MCNCKAGRLACGQHIEFNRLCHCPSHPRKMVPVAMFLGLVPCCRLAWADPGSTHVGSAFEVCSYPSIIAWWLYPDPPVEGRVNSGSGAPPPAECPCLCLNSRWGLEFLGLLLLPLPYCCKLALLETAHRGSFW